MRIYGYLFALAIIVSSLNAHQYSIILFSTKIIYPKDKEIFIKQFPSGFIEKQKKYYVFKLGIFKNYKQAEYKLKVAKKYYKDAFITKGDNKTVLKRLKYKKKIIQNNITQKNPTKPVQLNEPMLFTKKNYLPALHRTSIPNNKPRLNEPKILETWQIPDKYKTTDTNKYDILNLTKYINAVLNYNDNAKEAYYQKKIDYILSEIKKDKYGFDIYTEAYISTGQSISTNANNIEGNGGYTNAGISLNADKIIYDGQKKVVENIYDILYDRLSQIKEINAKEKLIIMAISIYTNLYTLQEEIKEYNKILKKQTYIKQITTEGYKKGKISVIDYLDAKDDYINLQRYILNLKYQYLYNDYILRQSIKSQSRKPFKLYPAKISIYTSSLKILQKEAVTNNSNIAIQSNILKIKEANFISDKRRYYPSIDFSSNIGYGLSTDNTFDLGNAGKGMFWTLELTAKIPLYQRGDITLSKDRDMYGILKQKRVLSAKQRDILSQVEKSYNKIQKTKKEKYFLTELLKIGSIKLKILTTRYINGISSYKEYSDALAKYLNYKRQSILNKQSYIIECSLLYTLIGKRGFYGQD